MIGPLFVSSLVRILINDLWSFVKSNFLLLSTQYDRPFSSQFWSHNLPVAGCDATAQRNGNPVHWLVMKHACADVRELENGSIFELEL
jgi:hypothetical protein